MNKKLVEYFKKYDFTFSKNYAYGKIKDYEVNIFYQALDNVAPVKIYVSFYASENDKNQMIADLNEQKINSKQAKILLQKLFEVKKTISELINELGFKQIDDEIIIGNIIEQYINKNLDLVSQYAQRPERVEKFLVGMVMKETNSQANPIVTQKILLNKLAKFK